MIPRSPTATQSPSTRRPRLLHVLLASLLVATGSLVGAGAASAAPVHEITSRWADGTPTIVSSGDVLNAEWRVNVNDDAPAPSNEPVENVNFTLTLENGSFEGLPDSCLTTAVEPVSSISPDGRTLVCNLGTQVQGSAHVVLTGIRAEGPTGADVTGAGTIAGATTELPGVQIVNEFGMDMAWENPTATVVFDENLQYADVDYQWTLFLDQNSEAGPNSVSYTVDVAADNQSPVTITPGAGCTPFTAGNAGGHPWSGGNHPDDTTSPFVADCTLSPTGTPGRFTLTLTGIDYSLQDVPTRDSTNSLLPVDRSAIASGSVTFRVATTENTGTTLTTDAPTYTAPVSGATVTDDPGNNTSSKAIVFPGGLSSYWARNFTGAGGTAWDNSYQVAQGTLVQQYMSIDTRPHADRDPDSLFGLCHILDSRYVDFEQANVGGGIDVSTYPVQYYVGDDPLLDPDSASYDPNAFSCATGGNTMNGGNGWVTVEPDDLTTVRAVRLVYPQSMTQAHPAREALAVQSTIQEDAPIGQDVWSWGTPLIAGTWNNHGANGRLVTETPDDRYPGTNGLRDILHVVSATPAVEKSIDRAIVRPGVPATYTLTYSANGSGGAPPTVDDYQLVDTLPVGMTYVDGSASPAPTVTTSGEQQVLTWDLDGVATNTQHALTYQATAVEGATPGAVLTNSVDAHYGGNIATDTAQVTVTTNGYTTIGKTADTPFIPNLTGDGVGEGSWTVTLRSFDPLPQDYTDTIDILPYEGDQRGTDFEGDYSLTGVDAETGATVYYTTADPATLSDDPADPSNGGANTVAGNTVGWTTTFTADATAVRVIGGTLEPGAIQQFTVHIATDGADGGDLFVNRAQARDGHTELAMRTSAPMAVAQFYSASLKKYVQDADGQWRDANDVSDYPAFKYGDTVNYRIVVENTGQGTLTNVQVSDDRNPDAGAFLIEELAPGEQEAHEYYVELTEASSGTVVNTASAIADTPPDSNVPPTIPPDPAGFEVVNYTTVKVADPASGEPVGPGDTISYTILVTQEGDAPADAVLIDDLSDVLDDAVLNDDVEASIGDVTAEDGILAWAGTIPVGEVAEITYSVTVKPADQLLAEGNTQIINPVTSPGCEVAEGESVNCATAHPAGTFSYSKVADPTSGATVTRGQDIAYTVTVTQLGDGAVADASIADNLADVLDDATYNGDAKASSGSVVREGNELLWSGDLAVGQVVTITYTVTATGNGNDRLINPVTSDDGRGVCDVTVGCQTTHDLAEQSIASFLPSTGSALTLTGLVIGLVLVGAGGVALTARRRETAAT